MWLHALRRLFQSVYVCMYILYLPDLKSKNLLMVGIKTSPSMYCISKLYTIVGCLDMSGADVLCWLNNKNNAKQTRMLLTTFGHMQPLLYYIIGACGIIVPTEPQHYTVHCIFPLLCLMYTVYMGHWTLYKGTPCLIHGLHNGGVCSSVDHHSWFLQISCPFLQVACDASREQWS